MVTTLAGKVGVAATTDGTGTGAAFNGPQGMCFDSNGNILVCTITEETCSPIFNLSAMLYLMKPGANRSTISLSNAG